MKPMQRRDFIAKSTAGAFGLTFIPSYLARAQSNSNRPSPSKRINLAMIGTGRQAYNANLSGFFNIPEIRIVAVCDVDRVRAQAAKDKIDQRNGDSDCKLFTDFREALAMDDLDAIMNSTPDHWHALISLAAIKRGLHVCSEKPLTRYINEGRALANAAEKAGIVFRTDSECRSNSYMIKTANLALNGYLGNITRFEIGVPAEKPERGNPTPMPVPKELDYDMWLGPAPEKEYTLDRVHTPGNENLSTRPGWMRCLDYAEGMICNWGTHLLDVASLINQTERTGPISIEGTGTYPEPESGLWDTLVDFQAQLKYANGVKIDFKLDVPYLRVEGDEGWIQAHWHSEGGLQAHDRKIFRTKFKESEIQVPTRSDKIDFVSAILNGTSVMADAEIGHRTCSLGQLAHIAIQRGHPMHWNPDTEQFTNDNEANSLLAGNYRGPWKI